MVQFRPKDLTEGMMRGTNQPSGDLFFDIDLEKRGRQDHPLQPIGEMPKLLVASP
ncbi:MAG: hypothetical protein HQL37_03135 [Alphaproteobacteria bacterium]|nr:hypothetical protein [Alphaproteobacteria bacterium]